MQVSLLLAVVGCALVVAKEPILLHYHENEGIPEAARIKYVESSMDFDGRIVGGSPAAVGTYPFLVSIVIRLESKFSFSKYGDNHPLRVYQGNYRGYICSQRRESIYDK